MLRIIYGWTKSILIMVGSFIFVLPAYPILIRTSCGRDFLRANVRWWARATLRGGKIEVKLTGKKVDELKGPFFIMANHQSMIDIIALIAILPFGVGFLARKEFFRIPILRGWMETIGCVKIDRENRESAITSLDKASTVAKERNSVVIFPEGTRSPDGRLGGFKKGGFVAAIKSELPILPINIVGTHQIMPKHKHSFKPGIVYIKIDELIETSGYSPSEKEALMDRVHTLFQSNIEELNSMASIS